MDYNASFQISASGMSLEKLRLDVTAANLANMNVAASSPDKLYRPMRVLAQAVPLSFSKQFDMTYSVQNGGAQAVGLEPLSVVPRTVYEPGHPYADAKGFVSYPGVNHAAEMVNLTTALRAYDANVVALNAARTMASRALEIGGQS